jgi:D-tyrosyl-tRNA(Tyr) deacylase
MANELYEYFAWQASIIVGAVQTGKFQAMMDVELVNDGPVTIILDSEKSI